MTHEELLAHAVKFTFPEVKIRGTPVSIESRGSNRWAVTDMGSVLANDGEWEYEPLPSNRDDEFIARTRFTLEEALDRVHKLKDYGR